MGAHSAQPTIATVIFICESCGNCATAEAVTQSLVSIFEIADLRKSPGASSAAKELLDRGAEKVLRDLKDQPVVQAKLMDTIGGLYHKLFVLTIARTSWRKLRIIQRGMASRLDQ